MSEWIGKTVGKVRIEKAIGKGGMAEVYLGTHLTLDRPVAVKVMHNYVEADPDLQARFEREAKVVAGLRHPNIVQIFDFDTAEGRPYIVMEYLRGASLSAYLKELHGHNQRLRPPQIARLLLTIATALDYAHEQGVVHRDIKPGNIILHNKTKDIFADQPISEQTEPVLTDFGLVRIAQAVTQTASGAVSGTPAYMSPEQAQGVRVDHRSDIYSLGVVLYEMIAGRIPFEGDTSWTVIFKHINEPPPAIPDIQPAVQRVIDRALAKKPEDRYQTARELAADYMNAIGMVAAASTLRMSLPASRPPTPAAVSQSSTKASTPAWIRPAAFAGMGVVVIGLAIWGLSLLAGSTQATLAPTETHQIEHPTTQANGIIPATAPIGVLRFQDGAALADTITISTDGMPPPPEGNQYEAWLIEDDGEQRISLKTISFDPANKGLLTFTDGEGRNLLSRYSGLEITLEPNPDSNPNSSNNIAYSVRLPKDGLTHVRHLLYSFNATPNEIGFIDGLDTDTRLLSESADQLLTAFESGNEAEVSLQGERMLNLIVGSKQTEDYKDWNGDGSTDDPGDGYGLLLNGENLGYIQGTYSHADLALTSPNATQNMIVHGNHVKACADNISNWTAELRTRLIDIITNPSNPERGAAIRQAVAIANQIRVGLDVNGDEKVEPIFGEGGALTAYEHAYYMADMLILPAANQTATP
jgi:tRNA A-37 threonylcarbamoyl transferase component Bud32